MSGKKHLVRVWRRGVDRWPFDAFVVQTGKKFALLQPVSGRLDLDGYEVVRVSDVTRIEVSPKERVSLAALRLKKQRPRALVGIDLDSTRGALRSLSFRFPVIVINREGVERDSCEIGQVVELGERRYRLLWLTPEAKVETDNRSFLLSQITRLGVGGDYETTLALLAGLKVRRAGGLSRRRRF